jgi:hypothetical protein
VSVVISQILRFNEPAILLANALYIANEMFRPRRRPRWRMAAAGLSSPNRASASTGCTTSISRAGFDIEVAELARGDQ